MVKTLERSFLSYLRLKGLEYDIIKVEFDDFKFKERFPNGICIKDITNGSYTLGIGIIYEVEQSIEYCIIDNSDKGNTFICENIHQSFFNLSHLHNPSNILISSILLNDDISDNLKVSIINAYSHILDESDLKIIEMNTNTL